MNRILYSSKMHSLDWQNARKHQTNSSTSKAAFAFGRDSRFLKDRPPHCDSFYNLPSSLGKAPATGIGRGSKVSLLNPNVSTPSPQNYHIKSSLSLNKSGVKFGLGREIKYNGIFNKSETPEPGHYDSRTEFGQKKGFTIYSKLALPVYSNAKNPSPAHYRSTDSLTQEGRYVLSQLSNCPGYKIKPEKQRTLRSQTPGPGQYGFQCENLSATGSYLNSKHENSRCRTFSRSAKGLPLKLSGPGPAAYNCYSQFGRKD